jgi:dihydroxy-acid dehydratase
LSIGHVSPEAAAGGEIALLQDGDKILIDIPSRKIELLVSDEELSLRKSKEEARGKEAYKPVSRVREISRALKAYAQNVSSADMGAIRLLD